MIVMNMAIERKVVESFLSTLKLNEYAPDDQECMVALSMGELRQHVQYCQYAADCVNAADAANKEFSRMSLKARRADGIVKKTEEQFKRVEELLHHVNNINSHAQLFRRKLEEANKVQKDLKSEIVNATSDP